jgi:anthranilate synthase
MIVVERRESAATAADAEALLHSLDHSPGIWIGCDVHAEGLFRRESTACAKPALRFSLEGSTLVVVPLSGAGAGMLQSIGRLGEFDAHEGGLRASMRSGVAVLQVLRKFLAGFRPQSRELALFGALSFDYYRFGDDAALPEDGQVRLVLYLPEAVVVSSDAGVRRVDFSFGPPAPMPPARPMPARATAETADEPPGTHASRVAQAVDLLREGGLYALVLSQSFHRPARVAAGRAFAALRQRNPYPAMFFCNLGEGEVLFGASPDMQVRADDSWIETAPVCGTFRRGVDPLDDDAQARALLASGKEAAALALCADSAANELAACCEPASIELLSHRRPYFFSTIIHTIDHLRGRRREGVDAFDILLAHATPATVTGVPKPAAIAAIERLESSPRGWYAGAVVRIGSDGSLDAHTVLRAARIAGGIAEVRCGGNILVDSDPQSEEDEVRLKAQTLFRVLEGAEPAPLSASPASVRWQLRQLIGADPFRERLLDALARAGARLGPDGVVSVLCGTPPDGIAPEGPLLAVGEGALWLLETQGAKSGKLPSPRFGRVETAAVQRDTFLGSVRSLEVGGYAARGLRADGLPRGWRPAATTADGYVLAAENAEASACALLFRPDSILSLRAGAGVHAIESALARLDPYGILAARNKEEAR